MKRHHVVTLAIVSTAAAFIGLLTYGLSLDPKAIPSMMVNKHAQPFRVAFVQGKEHMPKVSTDHFNLDDFKGKPIVLNFWASWCVSCREEAAELEKFWKAHGSDVMVVGIAIQDETAAAEKFAKYFGKTYVIGLDEDGKAAIDYGVSGVPETFLIDKDGVVRHKEIGPVTVASLEKLLPKLH